MRQREFWSLPPLVDHHTLIPRPETETLVEWALALRLADARVLDLGTGSGAIALALAVERPGWRVSAMDASAGALAVARLNAEPAGAAAGEFCAVRLVPGAVPGERFHLLVANPPYIDAGDEHLVQGMWLRAAPRWLRLTRAWPTWRGWWLVRRAPSSRWLAAAGTRMQPGEVLWDLLRDSGFGDIYPQRPGGTGAYQRGACMLSDEQLLRYNRQLLLNDFDIAGAGAAVGAACWWWVWAAWVAWRHCTWGRRGGQAAAGGRRWAWELGNLQRQIAHGEGYRSQQRPLRRRGRDSPGTRCDGRGYTSRIVRGRPAGAGAAGGLGGGRHR